MNYQTNFFKSQWSLFLFFFYKDVVWFYLLNFALQTSHLYGNNVPEKQNLSHRGEKSPIEIRPELFTYVTSLGERQSHNSFPTHKNKSAMHPFQRRKKTSSRPNTSNDDMELKTDIMSKRYQLHFFLIWRRMLSDVTKFSCRTNSCSNDVDGQVRPRS